MANKEATLLLRIKEAGGEILDRFVITFGDLINVASKIPQAIGAAISAYREQELAVNELNQSMINQGVYSAELQNKYLNLADSLSKVTLFGDEQITSAQAILQGHIGQREVTEKLTRATMDLAQAKKMDLASAAELMGKAIAGERDILSRYGITINEAAAQTDKMGAVISAVSGKFNGYAEAATLGLGKTELLTKSSGELYEAIGSRLTPAVSYLAEGWTNVINAMAQAIGSNKLAAQSTDQLQAKIDEIQQKMANRGALSAWAYGGLKSELEEAQAMYAEAWTREQQSHRAHLEKKHEAKVAFIEKAKEVESKQFEIDMANRMAQDQMDLAMIGATEEQRLALMAQYYEREISQEKDKNKKLELERGLHNIRQTQMTQKQQKIDEAAQAKRDADFIQGRTIVLNQIATLQTEKNKELANIGKAAALAQIYISTAEGVAKAWSLGPIIGPAAAAVVAAAGAAQASKVASVKLAEGGIVRARPGGIQATIGEGGQDEAVIPLDKAGGLMGGNNITIVVNGGLMGDESSAYQFAKAIDNALLNLRRNNESRAFDEGLV